MGPSNSVMQRRKSFKRFLSIGVDSPRVADKADYSELQTKGNIAKERLTKTQNDEGDRAKTTRDEPV